MPVVGRQMLFQPTQLGGCVLWLRADQGLNFDASGLVTSWGDLSGNGNGVSQATASKRPVWVAPDPNLRKPCLTLLAANTQCLTNSAQVITSTNWTIFSIHQFASITNQAVISFGGAATNGIALANNGTSRDVSAIGVIDHTDGTNTTNWEAWIATNDGTTTRLWVNGQPQALASPTTNQVATSAGVNIGLNTNSSNFFNGNIAEQGAFNRPLNAAEVSQMSAYFLSLYGIGAP